VIQEEGDADVEITKAAVTKSAFKCTTLVGEDTDVLLLLFYYAEAIYCTELYFPSNKVNSRSLRSLRSLRRYLEKQSVVIYCSFVRLTSRVFGIGKKSGFERITDERKENERLFEKFCLPKQSQNVVETSGCRAMVALFDANRNDSLASIRYTMLCK